jgi:hypothetical protein
VDERGKPIHHFPFTVVFECGHKMINPERFGRVRLLPRQFTFTDLEKIRELARCGEAWAIRRVPQRTVEGSDPRRRGYPGNRAIISPQEVYPFMKTKYVLLLEHVSQGVDRGVTVSCAVVGKPTEYYGLTKNFENEEKLNLTLSEARVFDFEMNDALTTVRSGFRSFAPITYDQAQSLGLLADDSQET